MSYEKAIRKCKNKIRELFEKVEHYEDLLKEREELLKEIKYYKDLLDERKRLFMVQAISLLKKDFPHSKYTLDFECTHILEFYKGEVGESSLDYDTVFDKDGIIIRIYLKKDYYEPSKDELDLLAETSKQLIKLYYDDDLSSKQDQTESKE